MLHLFAFILGAVSAPLMSKTLLGPPVWLLVPAIPVFLGYLFLRRSRNRKVSVAGRALLACCWALVGMAVAMEGVSRVVAAQVPDHWHGQNIRVQGQVMEVIEQSEDFSRFHFRVQSSETEGTAALLAGGKLRLSWYYGAPVSAGETWSFTVRLKRPRGFVNPRGFDYAAWLLAQDIIATGYVRAGENIATQRRSWTLDNARAVLAERLFGEQTEAAPFFRALLLGDTNGLSAEQWRVLQRTGTIHLMAISGLHVGLVAVVGTMLGWGMTRMAILLPLFRRSSWLSRFLPPLVSCLLALGYSALAGFSIPTQRAMIVIALVNVALLAGLRVRPVSLLMLACILVLTLSPLAATQNGFWLSFIAVFVLILGFAGRAERRHSVLVLMKAQVLLAVGLLAPLLALGTVTSFVGPVANVVAVPVVSLFVVPGLLLAAGLALVALPAAQLLIWLLDKLFGLLWAYLALLGEMEWAQWWPAVPTTNSLVIAMAVGCLLMILPRGLYLRPLGFIVVLLSLVAPRAAPPFVQMTVLEVGQGLAVWFRAGEYDLLYDTGPAFSEDFDAGSRIVVPFLQSQGVKALDMLIVSHGDGDHSGGVDGVLRNMPVAELASGSPKVAARHPDGRQCLRGERWQSGEVSFRILWPQADNQLASNNRSCVLLISWGTQNVLLTGDIEARVEHQILKNSSLPTDLSVLVAGHHGSKTSSGAAFVKRLNPRAVVFSAGYRNRYGHPHPDVVDRFVEVGAELFNTGEQGAISFRWMTASDAIPEAEKAREKINRAWY